MNAVTKPRKSPLILATLGALTALGLSSQSTRAQEGPGPDQNRQLDGPSGSPQQLPPGGRGGPRFGDGPRPGDGPRGEDGPRPDDGPGRNREIPPPPRQTVQLSGSVVSYNFGPRGNIDSLMIKSSDKTIQVNLPGPLAPFVIQQAVIGSQVKMTAIPEMGLPDHAVYELTSLTGEQGREIKLPTPEDRKFIHEEGTIKSLNYARHGEVDGAILSNGDFVHIGPAAASLKLTVNQKITIDGVGHPMLASENHAVEAVAINGNLLEPSGRPGVEGGRDPRNRGDQMPPEERRGSRRGGPGGQAGPDHPPQGPRGFQGGPGGPEDRPQGPQGGFGGQRENPGGPPQGPDGPPRGPNGPGNSVPRPGRGPGQESGPNSGSGQPDAPSAPDRNGTESHPPQSDPQAGM